jgi:hypothetical protein
MSNKPLKTISVMAALLFILFTPLLSAQKLETELVGRKICDRIFLIDFLETPDYLYYLTHDDEVFDVGANILRRMKPDGSNPEILSSGPYRNLYPGEGRIYLFGIKENGQGIISSYDLVSGKTAVLITDDIIDPPAFRRGVFYYTVTGKGFFSWEPLTGKKTLLYQDEVLLPTAADSGIAGWLMGGGDFRILHLALPAGKISLRPFDMLEMIFAGGDRLFLSGDEGLRMFDPATGEMKLIHDRLVYGNILLAGDWLYFVDTDNKELLTAANINTGEKKILSRETGCHLLSANDRGLYYTSVPVGDSGYSFGQDSRQYLGFFPFEKSRCRELLFASEPFNPSHVGNGLVWGVFPQGEPGLFAVDLKTGTRRLVASGFLRSWVFGADSRFVYYFGVTTQENRGIVSVYRTTLDGSGPSVKLVEAVSWAVPFSGGVAWLDGDGGTLFLTAADGTENSLGAVKGFRFMAGDGDSLVLLVTDETTRTDTLVRINGKTGKRDVLVTGISTLGFPVLAVSGGQYFYMNGTGLCRLDPASGRIKVIDTIVDSFIYSLVVSDGYCYYNIDQIGGNGIFRVGTDGGGKVKMADGELFGLAVDDGWLYWFADLNDRAGRIPLDTFE